MSEKNINFFGRTLKQFRLERGITEKEMAEHLSISVKEYIAYEEGETRPELDLITAAAEKFSVNPLELIGGALDRFNFPPREEKERFSDN